jgi:hypothetical protein
MRVRSVVASFMIAGLVAGCDGPGPVTPGDAVFNKGKGPGGGGGSNSSETILAQIQWQDALEIDGAPVAAGIRGDGRQADGTDGPSAYEGGLCGVNASFTVGGTAPGHMTFDTYTATDCGALRVHHFYMQGAEGPVHTVATKSIARSLWDMAVEQVATDELTGFQVGLPECTRVVYSAQHGTENPIRTRQPDVNGARQWRVESQGSHQAACVYTFRGRETTGALTEPMPFAYIVTEVLP